MKVSRILFLFAALLALGMALVHLRAETQQAGYVISKLQGRQRELKRECLELELELARLRNPVRLEDEVERMALELDPPGPSELAGF